MRLGVSVCVLLASITWCSLSGATTLAFPGVAGAGASATGGRGGAVVHVTNLKPDGPGSLADAVSQSNRIVVFDVSGIIDLSAARTGKKETKKAGGKIAITQPNITIAGQTAPGDGITLKDFTFQIKSATNVIVRYLRVRLGDEHKAIGAKGGDDALNTDDVDQLILDHCSLSWAIDGTHDLRRGGNFTLQWCILSEALNHSLHNKIEHAMRLLS